jgi:signal peptidase II
MSDSDDTNKPAPQTPAEATDAPKATDAPPQSASDEEGPASSADGAASDVQGGEVIPVKREEKEPLPPPPTAMQWAFLAGVGLITAGLDLWSKAWAIKRLSMVSPRPVPLCTPPTGMTHYLYQRVPHNEIVLSRNWFELRYAENCGGAFGFLHGANEKFRRPFFFLVTVLAIIFIVHLYRSLEKDQRAMRLALPLVLGGAIGNLVDRLRLGYVVDFIVMHWKDRYYWPTYNIADVAITVGIGLMVLEFIVGGRKKPADASAAVKPASTAA